MKAEKSLQIVRRRNLTTGQQTLLELVVEKIEKKEPVFYMEAKSIWMEKVCRNMIDGVPCWYNYWHSRTENNEPIGGYEPMSKEMVVQRVLLWLTSNIGALVLKGYLKVIPVINVEEVKALL